MKLRQLLSTLVITAGLIVTVGLVQQRQLFQKKAAPAEAETSLSFIHQDHLGSISMVTDAAGHVVSRKAYYPYGSIKSSEGEFPTERGYTGQVSDSQETGLLYYNARYYDPVIAKFTQADTANDGLNRYAYVGNNPIDRTDSTGYCKEEAGDYKECMSLVAEIEKKYPNIFVITNGNGKEWESWNYKGWTAYEVALLRQVLDNHPFRNDLDQRIVIFRSSMDLGPAAATIGYTELNNTNASVALMPIFDKAWKSWPYSVSLDFFSLFYRTEGWQAFAGTLAHELTHAAVVFHPELLDNWISASGNRFGPGDFRIGFAYGWDSDEGVDPDFYNRYVQEELFAMATSGLMYNSWWGQSNFTDPYLSLNHLKTPFEGGGGKPYKAF